MTREQQIVWAAGFFDGEGCICSVKATKDSKSRLLKVAVVNTHRGSVERFVELFGGHVIEKRPQKIHHKQQYCWWASARKAERMLRELAPFLLVKQPQAKLAIAMRDLINNRPRLRDTVTNRALPETDLTRFGQINTLALQISQLNGHSSVKDSGGTISL